MENKSRASLEQWTFGKVVSATLVLVGVLLGFWLLYRFYTVVFIAFIAIIMGTVLRPIVNWLYIHKIPKVVGVLLVYFIIFAMVIAFLFLLFPLVIDQGSAILVSLPEYYQAIRTWLIDSPNQLNISLGQIIPREIPGFSDLQITGPDSLTSTEQALVYVNTVSKGVLSTIVVLLLAFYWTIDGPRAVQSLLIFLPNHRRTDIKELISEMEIKIGYFVFGKGVLSLMVGGLALLAYLLIGLPNVLVLAIIAGIFETIPMIGPILGAVPAAIIALSISPAKFAWVVGAIFIIQQLESYYLTPRVMSKAVGVNPFVSLLSIFAFASLFGVAGALMAIPIAAVIQLLLNRFVFHPVDPDSENSTGRDKSSRLYYEAKELARDLRKQARLKKGWSPITKKQNDLVMDEIESISADLATLLAELPSVEHHD